jgi:hypothetical protein
MKPSPLLPAIPQENLSPQICLSLSNLKLNLKEVSYPETPPWDYLLDLASQVEDLNIISDGEGKKTIRDVPLEEITEKQQGDFPEVNLYYRILIGAFI